MTSVGWSGVGSLAAGCTGPHQTGVRASSINWGSAVVFTVPLTLHTAPEQARALPSQCRLPEEPTPYSQSQFKDPKGASPKDQLHHLPPKASKDGAASLLLQIISFAISIY